jgi:hypothetical protein
MKVSFFFSLLFLVISSCTRHKMPADILPQPRMQAVLWDLMRADEFIINYASKDSGYNKTEESLKLYEQVYTIHKTTKAEFQKSLSYYNREPGLFKAILDSLEKRKVSIMQEQYQNMSSDSSKRRIKLVAPQ